MAGEMKAIVLTSSGNLIETEVPKPAPGDRDLLVEVRAVSVNPVDTKQRAEEGKLRILGWDVAGIVREVGPACTLFRPGDEVYYAGDITRPGGFSEYHVVDERLVGPKPRTSDFAQAAALPLTTLTAWEGLFEKLGVQANGGADKRILIVGAAGGVGSMAVQLARWAGLEVIGTASRPESTKWVREYGAHHVIDHYEPFRPQLEALGISGVDAVFCLNVVEPNWDAMLDVLVPGGKLCTILPPNSPVNLRPLFDKSLTWAMEGMFTRARFRTPDMQEQHRILVEVSGLVDSGEIRTTMNRYLSPISAANLERAFAEIRSGRSIGKIVLESFA
ncbi:zinc-binding alcohol dehydrogenase family protein [Kyrpidia spormannii]|uniref:zinc-binding alcohol dehydrogenase family protein n=1 Tax=Kyrpidia spormannii TaxID=2055160 RepID=UPI001E52482C|nr:zinc-binding alcohol dehydrogenase family protein [Kyrpidia spormannii]